MTKHLDRDMDQLHRDILSLCTIVEDMIGMAAMALRDGRLELCDRIAAEDDTVDHIEVAIEEECLKMLALHHPVAMDLRRIATVVKVNNDLERIADLAVNIADRARGVREYPDFAIPQEVDTLVTHVRGMVRGALDAFVHLNTDAARGVIQRENTVDELNERLIGQLQHTMQSESALVVPALHCFSAIRHLARIGDLATNIAEDAIYLVNGEIIRHR